MGERDRLGLRARCDKFGEDSSANSFKWRGALAAARDVSALLHSLLLEETYIIGAEKVQALAAALAKNRARV